MSRIFGEIRQNGYVVRDIEAAMHHWIDTLGVGPFFYIPEVRMVEFSYRGRPSSPRLSIALANSGDLQIELVQQHDEAPSMYRDFLAAGREGLQHVSSWVEDFDTAISRIERAGHSVVQSGAIEGGVRFAYFDTELHPGTVFEVSNLAGPFAALPRMVADAARCWDGSEPIRVIAL